MTIRTCFFPGCACTKEKLRNSENNRSVITRIDKSKMFCLRGTILKNHVFWSTVFGDVEIRTKQTLFC